MSANKRRLSNIREELECINEAVKAGRSSEALALVPTVLADVERFLTSVDSGEVEIVHHEEDERKAA